jgi:hypothetical protein
MDDSECVRRRQALSTLLYLKTDFFRFALSTDSGCDWKRNGER